MSIVQSFIRSLKNYGHLIGACASNIKYGFPSRKLLVIGVTGTDGKTTTSHLIYHILHSAGEAVSLTSTVFTDIAGDVGDTGLHVTTQNHWQLQKNIARAVKQGSRYFVLETTSHALDQHRVWGVQYKVGVLTNITSEHLDYHKSFENYFKTKMQLLLRSEIAILNKDAEVFEKAADYLTKKGKKFLTYSVVDASADGHWDDTFSTKLKEDFNKQNILAAYVCCKKLGIPEDKILKGIKTFTLPKGRLDKVHSGTFDVYIDFAHTPNSIRSLLQNFKSHRGRLIHIFGSAGLRDAEKRPEMGRASAENADIVILTEEDYRTEDFDMITRAVSKGLFESGFSYVEDAVLPDVEKGSKVFTIVKNRQKAIELGISIADKSDVVVCTGKGHEKSLARGTKEYPWDEYKAVEKALKASSEI